MRPRGRPRHGRLRCVPCGWRCRRGALPFLPELGSRLLELGKEKPAGRAALARQYAAQALCGMGLEVEDAKVTQTADGHARVEFWLRYADAQQAVEVNI